MPQPAGVMHPDGEGTASLAAIRDDIAVRLFAAARAGGAELMAHWKCAVKVSAKTDGSLVSAADHAADAAVRAALREAGIAAPLVSEEGSGTARVGDELFLLLDPLDGTSEFLAHGDEFCVCLAAVWRGRAIAGAIVAPALGRGWYGGATAHVALLPDSGAPAATPLAAGARAPSDTVIGLVSRRHGDARSEEAIRAAGVSATRTASSAIKFGLLAEGGADLHVRHGRTMTWDIAAGDAILSAAGGQVLDFAGRPLRYNDPDSGFANPPFIAVARPDLAPRLLASLQRDS